MIDCLESINALESAPIQVPKKLLDVYFVNDNIKLFHTQATYHFSGLTFTVPGYPINNAIRVATESAGAWSRCYQMDCS